MKNTTHVEIRMYRAGTGDCFILKFLSQSETIFTMMIDGGTWSGTKIELQKIVRDLKKYVNNTIDLLVITHEHKDHVHLFDACEALFTEDNFNVNEVWMAWCEDDNDELVKEWKTKYGQKKKALALASDMIEKGVKNKKIINQLRKGFEGEKVVNRFSNFASALKDFKDLHFSKDKQRLYNGGLHGMEVVKNKLANGNIRYCKPGTVEKVSKLEGVNFNILGPPMSIDAIRDHGINAKEGEVYDHNKILRRSDSFSMAINDTKNSDHISPFDSDYYDSNNKAKRLYNKEHLAWRSIDLDWLVSGAGNLALRVNSGINNLSLVLAIEFENSKKVMLFPGDAEYGSWKSWHKIKWDNKPENFTDDLLKRTVFYKVSHHLSHNGTADELGMEKMTSDELVVMATLDYNKISPGWKKTMPNKALLRDIINKTKGRFIIMNEDGLYYDFEEQKPLKERIQDEQKRLTIKEKRAFKNAFKEDKLYKQFKISVD